MSIQRSILIMSSLDLTEKSIQVTRKTPEEFHKAGWRVQCLIARDTSPMGSETFYYQKEVNLQGVDIERVPQPNLPLAWLEKSKNHILRTIYRKIRGYAIVFTLASRAIPFLKKQKYDVIYGLGHNGVLAIQLLRLRGYIKGVTVVSRFLGTFLAMPFRQKRIFKILGNWDELLAMYLPSDLAIMTNDGTLGNEVIGRMRAKRLETVRFWVNGVDSQKLSPEETAANRKKYQLAASATVLVSISRLVVWKHVERGIQVAAELIRKYNVNLKYFIVGEGPERPRLEALVRDLGIQDQVVFVGAVTNNVVREYLNLADFFLSTYSVSNVGNPLLEAIRAHRLICTLNNGDTGSWIQHDINGFIYSEESNFIPCMASDILRAIKDQQLRERLIANIVETEKAKLWTWSQRMMAEINEVTKIVEGHV